MIAPYPHAYARLGAAGRILSLLHEHKVQDLVLVGPVRRPSLLDLRPDAVGTRILARIGRAAFSGDDGLLAAIVRVFAEEGFTVLGAHDIIAGALGPRGQLGRVAPDAQAEADIARGAAIVRALGAADVGQGCIVQQGIALAVEAQAGHARPGPGGRSAGARPAHGGSRGRGRAARHCLRGRGHAADRS